LRSDEEKQPEVWMSTMNASSVDYELLVWIEATNDKTRKPPRMKDFLELIYTALYTQGIEIPYPQLDVRLKRN
jgi:small-conductance mechanosensitive channel